MFNLGHSKKELDAVTQQQKENILPLLKKQLLGTEKNIADFGCGPGRFTPDLAELINGKCIGLEPIQHLIDLEPTNTSIEYKIIREGVIPLNNESIDIVWICLVLGGITDPNLLQKSISEIKRILKKNGLIFLIENTSDKKYGDYWKLRSVDTYQNYFNFVQLTHLHDYFDLGERISIMAGR